MPDRMLMLLTDPTSCAWERMACHLVTDVHSSPGEIHDSYAILVPTVDECLVTVVEPVLDAEDVSHATTVGALWATAGDSTLDRVPALCGRLCRVRGFRGPPGLQVIPTWPAPPTEVDENGLQWRRCQGCEAAVPTAVDVEPSWLWEASGPAKLLASLDLRGPR